LAKPVIKQEKAALVMTCNLEAKPQPDIKWFQGTTELKNGGRYDIKLTPSPGKPDSYTATLNIKVTFSVESSVLFCLQYGYVTSLKYGHVTSLKYGHVTCLKYGHVTKTLIVKNG
jgi:hypothetical protein